MEAVHRHSSSFRKKRLAFFALLVIAHLAAVLTATTGSVAAGIVTVFAVASALFTGVNIACHKGCSTAPSGSPITDDARDRS